MAYITQYDVDMQRQAKANQGLQTAIQGFQGMEENRQRALQTKRQQDNEAIQLAQAGASPESLKAFQETGDKSGIMADISKRSGMKLLQEQEDRSLNQKVKKSEIAANEAAAKEKSLPWEQTRDAQAYRAKMELEGEQKAREAAQRQATERPAQNEFAAAGFAKRARQAEAELGKLPEGTGSSWTDGVQEWLPNSLNTSEFQLFDQAKRNFITANLRKESGAAIGKEEYSNEEKKYFPQPGDSKEVIAQKSRAREQAMLNLEAEGSRALPRISEAPNTPPQVQQRLQQMDPNQKLNRLQLLRAKKAGVAMGGQ
jgi:hypothetical protein